MKRVLLVGGAGFIGHHLALALADIGHEVRCFDSLATNNLHSAGTDEHQGFLAERQALLRKARIPLVVEDARDFEAVCRQIRAFKPHVLVHLAAVAHAGRAHKDPHSTFDHSLRTLENALDASRANVEQFIFFSSSMAYGDFPGGIAHEDLPLAPKDVYGTLKACGEMMVKVYGERFALPWTIVRPSALYGERCVAGRVIQKFIEGAIAGNPIVVRGSGALDFTYIGDLVNGVLRAIVCRDSAVRNVFNLTYGQGRTIAELAEMIRAEFPDVKVRHEPADEFMPERGTLIVRKAKEMLGYDPRFPLEKGLKRYIDWYRARAMEKAA